MSTDEAIAHVLQRYVTLHCNGLSHDEIMELFTSEERKAYEDSWDIDDDL